MITEGWGCLSEHATIVARVTLRDERKLILTQTNCKKIMEYVEREKELEKEGLGTTEHQYEYTREPVRALRTLLNSEWTSMIEIYLRFKKWWKRESTQLRKEAAKNKEARKLRKVIKESKKN